MSTTNPAPTPATLFDGPYYLSIGGQLVPSGESVEVINPATGAPLAQAPAASLAQLDEAIGAARSAFASW